MNEASPRIVLFDLGSTLIYFDGQWEEVFLRATAALFQVLKSSGFDLDQASFLADFHARIKDYHTQRDQDFVEYSTLYVLQVTLKDWGYPNVSKGVLRLALKAMYGVSQPHWHVEPDAIATLESVHGLGYQLGIISNAGDDPDVQNLVDKAGIRPYFDVILSSAACGIRKPNPEIFRMALKHWDASPSQAIMVGDNLGADILGAHNAGIFGVWITRRADTPANQANAATIIPDAVIHSLSDLPSSLT
jgi:HAD superfamily hydrolase (TIGR01662 family)